MDNDIFVVKISEINGALHNLIKDAIVSIGEGDIELDEWFSHMIYRLAATTNAIHVACRVGNIEWDGRTSLKILIMEIKDMLRSITVEIPERPKSIIDMELSAILEGLKDVDI